MNPHHYGEDESRTYRAAGIIALAAGTLLFIVESFGSVFLIFIPPVSGGGEHGLALTLLLSWCMALVNAGEAVIGASLLMRSASAKKRAIRYQAFYGCAVCALAIAAYGFGNFLGGGWALCVLLPLLVMGLL